MPTTKEGAKYRVYHMRPKTSRSSGDRVVESYAAKGGYTRVDILDENGAIVSTGWAHCHPSDNYNRKLGHEIALGRALKPRKHAIAGDATYSDRGFAHLPSITCSYGSKVKVYESSAAESPHIWVAIESGPQLQDLPGEAHAHLSLEDAKMLCDQITWMIENHYHMR